MLVNYVTSYQSNDGHEMSLSTPISGEALPMDQKSKQGYRRHRVLSNLNRLNLDRLDAADQERVETARDLLEEVSLLTRLDQSRGEHPRRLLTRVVNHG